MNHVAVIGGLLFDIQKRLSPSIPPMGCLGVAVALTGESLGVKKKTCCNFDMNVGHGFKRIPPKTKRLKLCISAKFVGVER